MKKIITYPIRVICCIPIYLYKWFISPFLQKNCIYYPTCSSFALIAIYDHGVVSGTTLAVKRLLSCTPNKTGGEHYPPINLKGDNKWIF